MSLKTWAASGVSADNAHGVIRPTGRSGCRRAPGPPESLAGLATAPEFSSPTPPARRRTSPAGEQAGIAQGAQFVEADAGEDFHAAQRIGAAQGLLQLAGTAGQGAGANGGSAALDGGMGCVALPRHRPRRAGVRAGRRGPAYPERSAATPRRSAPAAAETPDDIAPRLDQFARVRCRCRRALAPLRRDDRAGKAPGALVDRLRHMVVHARRQAGFHGRPARRWRSWRGSAARRTPVGADSPVASRPSISGICMSISTASNGTLASSTC